MIKETAIFLNKEKVDAWELTGEAVGAVVWLLAAGSGEYVLFKFCPGICVGEISVFCCG